MFDKLTKRCTRCGAEKPLSQFHRKASSRDGHQPHCKPCNREQSRDWRQRNPTSRRQVDPGAAKRCTSCGVEKPVSEFHKQTAKPDGLHPYCKECNRVSSKQWNVANNDRARSDKREWYKANREEILERQRDYRQRNLDAIRRKDAQWQRDNPDKVRERNNRYRRRHPEKSREYANRRRARKAAAPGRVSASEFWEQCERYQWRCAYCGCQLTKQTVTMDHVVPLVRRGADSIDNIVPACRPCNSRKGCKLWPVNRLEL